jgi:HPt (histidine-containing phosphotransfer) domain-containing protein
MGEFDAYLPHLDAVEGIKRIMSNKKLYITMIGRFKARQMADDLLEVMKTRDHVKIAFAAHALRGAAGNLGFPTLHTLTDEIEVLAKKEEDVSHMAQPLDELIGVVVDVIREFVANEGEG